MGYCAAPHPDPLPVVAGRGRPGFTGLCGEPPVRRGEGDYSGEVGRELQRGLAGCGGDEQRPAQRPWPRARGPTRCARRRTAPATAPTTTSPAATRRFAASVGRREHDHHAAGDVGGRARTAFASPPSTAASASPAPPARAPHRRRAARRRPRRPATARRARPRSPSTRCASRRPLSRSPATRRGRRAGPATAGAPARSTASACVGCRGSRASRRRAYRVARQAIPRRPRPPAVGALVEVPHAAEGPPSMGLHCSTCVVLSRSRSSRDAARPRAAVLRQHDVQVGAALVGDGDGVISTKSTWRCR